MNTVGDCISVHDTEFHVLFQNTPHQAMNGPHIGELCYQAFGNRNEPCENCPLLSLLHDGVPRTVTRSISQDNGTRHVEVTVTPLRNQCGAIVAGVEVIRDVTARTLYEEKLRFMSSHDILTGLHNRLHFESELARFLEENLFPISFIMADVDDLKGINDMHGHARGDSMLQEVATILRNSFRNADIIARIGGDEFITMLPFTDSYGAMEAAARLRHQLQSFQTRFCTGPNLSIGHSTAEGAAEVSGALLAADHSMYRDKMSRTGQAPRQRFHYNAS